MEEIPLVTIKRGKIRKENKTWKKNEGIDLVDSLIEQYGMVYIIDMDGKKGKPNLKFYKSIGKKMWVDSFSRDLNDIIDLFVCGVEKITLRFFDENIEEVKNISENEIFIFEDIDIAKKYGLAGVVAEKDLISDDEIQLWRIYKDREIVRRIK